ncbi:MAG: LamG-like jellyroll fold domain-containing protein [Spirochaetota bacterium]
MSGIRIMLPIAVLFFTGMALPQTPAAYWSFDEGSGDTVKDSAGGFTGKFSGAVTWIAGKSGSALHFNGIDSFVNCGLTPALNFASDFTIMLWLKASKAGSDKNPYSGVIGKFMYGPGGKGISRYDIILHTSGQLRSTVRGEKNIDTGTVGPNLLDDSWHHIALAVTKTSVKYYADGKLVKDTAGEWVPNANEAPLTIGYRDGGMPAFNGSIDEVKFFSRALSEADIRTHVTTSPVSDSPAAKAEKSTLENMVKNPGFEDASDFSGWTLNNWAKNEVEGGINTENPRSGKQCMRVSMNKITGSPNLQFQQKVQVKAGLPVEFKFWLRGRANSKPLGVQFRKQNAPYTTYFQSDARISENWQVHSFALTLPPNTDPDDTAIFFNLNEENTYWIDDISVCILPAKDDGLSLLGNQMPNGSFETGTAKWSATFREYGISGDLSDESNANAQIESVLTPDAPHGKYALRTEIMGGCIMMLTSAYFPLRYGHPASVGFWVKSPAAGKRFTAKILFGKTHSVVQATKTYTASKAGWEFFAIAATPQLSSSKTYFIEIDMFDPGEYFIDSVTAVDDSTPMEKYEPRVSAGFLPLGKPGNVVFPGETLSAALNIESLSDGDMTLFVRIVDAWENNVKRVRIEAPVKNGLGTVSIPLPTDRFGCFKCEAFTDKDITKVPLADMIYSVVPKLPSPKASSERFFGGHVRLTPHNLFLAERMGLRTLRLHPPITTKWQTIARDGYVLDGIKRAHAMGFTIFANFDTVPPEYADAPAGTPKANYDRWWNSYGPKDADQWKQYVKDALKVFGPYISEWEIWNEPDGGFLQVKPGEDRVLVYTNIAAITRKAVDEIGAKITLVGGAVSSPAKPFLYSALEYGMTADIDAASFHFYYEDASPDESPSPSMVERIRDMRKLTGRSGKPLEVWHTEGGAWLFDGVSWLRSLRVPSGSAVTPFNAATGLARTLISLKAVGTKRHYQYAGFTHQSGRIINRDECSSMFESSGEALPTFAAHAAAVLMLESAEGNGVDEKRIGATKAVICRFMKNGKRIESLWSRIPVKISDAGISVDGMAGFDMMGNPVALSQDTLLTEAPLYLVQK